jgi:hypothetical protein
MLDIHEAPELEQGLRRNFIDVARLNLVPLGVADIYWLGLEAKKFTLEHKTAQQFIQEMGQRLDDQLRKHSQHADDVAVVIDGIFTPRKEGGCDLWRLAKHGKTFYKVGHVEKSYEAVWAFIWSLDKMGFSVYPFPDIDSLCLGVASFIANSLKKEHFSLRRYVKTRPVMWTPNPYVESLMGLGGDTRIGEATARKILDKVGTPFNYFTATYEDGIEAAGEKVFLDSMRAIGRDRIT